MHKQVSKQSWARQANQQGWGMGGVEGVMGGGWGAGGGELAKRPKCPMQVGVQWGCRTNETINPSRGHLPTLILEYQMHKQLNKQLSKKAGARLVPGRPTSKGG
jgi:hypothetical protein